MTTASGFTFPCPVNFTKSPEGEPLISKEEAERVIAATGEHLCVLSATNASFLARYLGSDAESNAQFEVFARIEPEVRQVRKLHIPEGEPNVSH